MGAEAGFDVSEVHVPLRLSGYLSLVLGLVSGFSFLAIPLLLIPVVAILIGLFTLRPSRQGRPVGTTAALLGDSFRGRIWCVWCIGGLVQAADVW